MFSANPFNPQYYNQVKLCLHQLLQVALSSFILLLCILSVCVCVCVLFKLGLLRTEWALWIFSYMSAFNLGKFSSIFPLMPCLCGLFSFSVILSAVCWNFFCDPPCLLTFISYFQTLSLFVCNFRDVWNLSSSSLTFSSCL